MYWKTKCCRDCNQALALRQCFSFLHYKKCKMDFGFMFFHAGHVMKLFYKVKTYMKLHLYKQ